jgi:hypothetical protein
MDVKNGRGQHDTAAALHRERTGVDGDRANFLRRNNRPFTTSAAGRGAHDEEQSGKSGERAPISRPRESGAGVSA